MISLSQCSYYGIFICEGLQFKMQQDKYDSKDFHWGQQVKHILRFTDKILNKTPDFPSFLTSRGGRKLPQNSLT